MWNISHGAAWINTNLGKYRHYCGAEIAQDGRRWTAKTVAGLSLSTQRSALDAVVSLEKSDSLFWSFEQFGNDIGLFDYGDVHHRVRPIQRGDRDQVFLLHSTKGAEYPRFIRTIVSKYFTGVAKCISCSSPMGEWQTRRLNQFDGSSSSWNVYLACACGYPVWKMDDDAYSIANKLICNNAIPWRRKQKLMANGGKHSTADIQEVMVLQRGRCVYCNKQFTDHLRQSKDHLLSLTHGGGDWALNLLLACRSCNSSRGTIPFRTFCRLLSPVQNKKILAHLKRRLSAVDMTSASKEALTCFVAGLAMHDPKHYIYRFIQATHPKARQNARTNRLLPRSAVSILRSTNKL